MEMENYQALLTALENYEKQVLVEYSGDSQLIFTGNNLINREVINIKDKLINPFDELYDWIRDEEVEIEGFIESIKSYNELYIKKNSCIEKKKETEQVIAELQLGKKNIKTIFSFKSKNEDLTDMKNLNVKVSYISIAILIIILKISLA